MLLQIPGSRGMLSGLLLALLGLWGGLIAFVGPYFHFAYTPDQAWAYTTGRLWLEILPAAGAVLGGLLMLGTTSRAPASTGGLVAAASGAWFAVGALLNPLWAATAAGWTGVPVGGTLRRVAEQLGFFCGLGVVIVFFAGLALGRFAVVGVRESRIYAPERAFAAAPTDTAPPAPDSSPAPDSVTTTEPATEVERLRSAAVLVRG
jgi:hypothetical protein